MKPIVVPHQLRYLGLKRATATSTHMRWLARFKCTDSGEVMTAIVRIPMDKLMHPTPIAMLHEQVAEIRRVLTAWCGADHCGAHEGQNALIAMIDQELVTLSGKR